MARGIGGRGIFARFSRANYELMPLGVILGFACSMATAFVGYAALQKKDVSFIKWKNPHPWIKVNPEETQKLFKGGQKYEMNAAVEQLKREIGSRR
ncbi:normal mucosa of esophagus-specific gene 1 protein-like [Antedon mediterranea]|uniref:normal mucosa of esophagus-specific gene 1 protein-like n=1 Tax=Antedon mediterranea TaxID=105859 RepID=UPI003AF8A11A